MTHSGRPLWPYFALFALVSFGCATARPNLAVPPGSYVTGDLRKFTDDSRALNKIDNIEALDFSADSQTVVVARHHTESYMWSVYGIGSGKIGREGEIGVYEFDPRGIAYYLGPDRVVTISHEGKVVLWEVATARVLWSYRGPKAQLNGLSVSTDGRIAVCGEDGLSVFDPRRGVGEPSVLFKEALPKSGLPCQAAAFSRDGQELYVAGWDQLVAVYTVGGVRLREFHVDGYVNDLALSQDGKTVVVATSAEPPVLNYRLYKQHLRHEYGPKETGNAVRVFKAATGELIREWTGYSGPVTAVAISPDGQYVAEGGWEPVVRLLSVADGRLLDQNSYNRHIRKLRFSADGLYLGVANWTKIYDTGPSLTIHRLTYGRLQIVPLGGK